MSYSITPGLDGQVQGMYAAPAVEGQMSYNITSDIPTAVQSGYGVQVEQPQFASTGLQYGLQGGATYMSPGMDGQLQYEYQMQPGLPQPQVQYEYQVQPGLLQPPPTTVMQGGNMMYGVDAQFQQTYASPGMEGQLQYGFQTQTQQQQQVAFSAPTMQFQVS